MTRLFSWPSFLVAGIILGLAQPSNAGLLLDDTIYEWGENIRYSFSTESVGRPRIEFRPRFDAVKGGKYRWQDGVIVRAEPYSVPSARGPFTSETYTEEREVDTKDLPVGSRRLSDPSRSYYDVVLMACLDGVTYQDIDRKTILVLRKIKPLPSAEVSWSIAENAKVLPNVKIEFSISSPPNSRNIDGPSKLEAPPELRLIRHGRYFPGSAMEPDQIVGTERSSHGKGTLSIASGLSGFGSQPHLVRQIVPKSFILTDSPDTAILTRSGVQFGPSESSTLPDFIRGLSGAYGTQTDKLHAQLTAPFVIGTYEAQIIGVGNAVIASRQFEVVPPDLKGSISIDPLTDKPMPKPPNIVVTLPPSFNFNGMERLLNMSISRIGRKGEMIDAYAYDGSLSNAPRTDQTITFAQNAPWQPGSYFASLYFGSQNILLDRVRFEIKKDRKDRTVWPTAIEPLLEPEEVTIDLPNKPFIVFGEKIALKVLHAEKKKPLKGGPFIAELYHAGHYTYGCYWREGYYTGAGTLLSPDGTGLLPTPGEPGKYEIRIFRPMKEIAIEGVSEADSLRITRPNQGTPWTNYAMELVGSKVIDVELPEKRIIKVEPYVPTDPGKSITFKVLDPGPEFQGHVLQLHLWRKPKELLGGLKSESSPTGIRISNAGGVTSASPTVDSFPASFTLDPIGSPGNFEIRLLDMTSGAFIAKADISLRDPLAFGGATGRIFDDWLAARGGTRGIEAWMPPKDACVDPVFDKPPKLEIVEWYPNDPKDMKDDEFKPAPIIWPGHPYIIQARFDAAPPDEIYRVKVDGERRARVYRSIDNPRIYRSEVVIFAPQPGEKGAVQ